MRRPNSHASRGPKFYLSRVGHIEIFGLLEVYIGKLTENASNIDMMKIWAKIF